MRTIAPNKNRVRKGVLRSSDAEDMNGLFIFKRPYPTSFSEVEIRCMVSDGVTTGYALNM